LRVPVVAAALCLIPSLATSQSLGDAARREAKKRADPAPATMSYSDADLRSGAEPPEAEDATTEATPVARPTPEEVRAQLDREEDERKQREARWRALCSQALARIEQAQNDSDRCKLFPGG
jgi:hypothetical protein